MANHRVEIGLIGLGEMGRNLALNMADHDISLAVYNRTQERTREFMEKEAGSRPIRPGTSLSEFVGLMRRPRAILMMIPAGRAIDDMIQELLPLLEPMTCLLMAGIPYSAIRIVGSGLWPRKAFFIWVWVYPVAGQAPAMVPV